MNNNYIDIRFKNLIDFIKEKSLSEVFEAIKHNFVYRSMSNPWRFNSIANYYNKHQLWGSLDIPNNNFEVIQNNSETLINHYEDFMWLYNELGDYRSKKILSEVLYYWFMLDDKKISELKDDFFFQYFDLDLIKCDENEIFVDVGAYTGDTLINYIRILGKDSYKKIYCYEIVPDNIKSIKEQINAFKLKNVVLKEVGASSKKGKMFIDSNEISSIKKLLEKGSIEIDTVKIDDDIKGPITFVKMDIEGGELDALLGMKNKIKKYKPKLAISVYHNNDHLWQIPKLIKELNPDYKLYLRYYGGPVLPTEYILYAI